MGTGYPIEEGAWRCGGRWQSIQGKFHPAFASFLFLPLWFSTSEIPFFFGNYVKGGKLTLEAVSSYAGMQGKEWLWDASMWGRGSTLFVGEKLFLLEEMWTWVYDSWQFEMIHSWVRRLEDWELCVEKSPEVSQQEFYLHKLKRSFKVLHRIHLNTEEFHSHYETDYALNYIRALFFMP